MTPSTCRANSFSTKPSGGTFLDGPFRFVHDVSHRQPPIVIGATAAGALHGLATLDAVTAAELVSSRRDLDSGLRRAEKQGIDHVTTVADAVFALEELGLQRTAKCVARLDSLCHEDPDKSDVDLESLKRLVRVMQANPVWGEPELACADGNCIHAEWPVSGGGRVTISFLPANRVDYTASSAPVTDDDALDIAGHHIEEEAIRNLRWFTDRLVAL